MGLIIGVFKLILRIILVVSLLIAFILLIPNLPPYTKFTSIKVEPTLERSGSLAPNDILNKPKHLYKDKILGPEYFQVWNDELYTSLATGEIVKLSRGGHVTFVTKIGQPCTGLTQEHICGRPLGFVIDEKNKNLIVADSYYGIWKVNLQSNKKQLLVSPHVAIDGKVPLLFNSVALDKNGDFYWTHSSSDFHLKDGVFAIICDPSGRLLYYNAAKNESKVLLDDLWFANGLAISPDNQFVVVAETSRYKLNKYYINGPKKGKSEVFIAGLPGLPDTVRPLPDGSGVLVSLYNVFDDENPLITKSMSETPLVRKFIARLFRLIEIPFEFLQTHFDNYVFESVVYYIGHFSTASAFTTGMSGIVQIDWNGNIVASYYNIDGSLPHISDAIVFNDQLLTGSPHNQDYIGAVPAPPLLKKAFAKTIKEKAEVKREQSSKPKVSEPKEVPKPTPKPVEKPQAAKPVENKQDKKLESVTKPTPAKQPDVKQETVTTAPEVKPKVTRQEKEPKADIKPKVAKDAENKPQAKVEPPKPKVEAPKPKVETPKPKIEAPKPKVETPKPKVEPPKPKVEPSKPKEEPPKQKVEPPKQKVEPPKQKVEPPKPKVESPKPKVEPPKPKVEPTVTESKPKAQPKQETVTQKPIEKPKNVQKEPEVKSKVESKPVIKESMNEVKSKEANVKQNVKETAKTDKETKPIKTPESKAVPKKTEDKNKPTEPKSKPKPKKLKEEPQKIIPIEEEIPSDTVKPNNEKLKVIKKNGPQEIPNPNL